jgi:hypothetical protein
LQRQAKILGCVHGGRTLAGLQMTIDGGADAGDGLGSRVPWARGARLAALARAESFLFGRGGQREELGVCAKRLARWARRLAIDAGRADGVNEAAVGIFIASENGGPFSARGILRSADRAIRFCFASRISGDVRRRAVCHVFDPSLQNCFVGHGDKISKAKEANYPFLAFKVSTIAFAFAMWESGGKPLN